MIPYEDSITDVAELRKELRYYIDVYQGIRDALRDVPLFPPPFVLLHLGRVGTYPEDSNRGKELQREHGSHVIPFKTECEIGAGMWERIRRGLNDEDRIKERTRAIEICQGVLKGLTNGGARNAINLAIARIQGE